MMGHISKKKPRPVPKKSTHPYFSTLNFILTSFSSPINECGAVLSKLELHDVLHDMIAVARRQPEMRDGASAAGRP